MLSKFQVIILNSGEREDLRLRAIQTEIGHPYSRYQLHKLKRYCFHCCEVSGLNLEFELDSPQNLVG